MSVKRENSKLIDIPFINCSTPLNELEHILMNSGPEIKTEHDSLQFSEESTENDASRVSFEFENAAAGSLSSAIKTEDPFYQSSDGESTENDTSRLSLEFVNTAAGSLSSAIKIERSQFSDEEADLSIQTRRGPKSNCDNSTDLKPTPEDLVYRHPSFEKDQSTFKNIVQPLLVEETLPVINWMKQNELIRREVKCGSCHTLMNWTKCAAAIDKYVWKCQAHHCSLYKRHVSIRKDSFFAHSKVTLQKWLLAIYCWCNEMSEAESGRILNLSHKTIIDFYRFCREVCTRYFDHIPIKLGGPGVFVPICESCFLHKPKYQRGKEAKNQVLVLSLVDTSTYPAVGFMQIVEQRDEATLLPIIEGVVRNGSIIYSNQWLAYKNLINDPRYQRKTVNRDLQFADPETNNYTQLVEVYWSKHRAKIKNMRGCRREYLNDYLQQFMWMERNISNRLIKFCGAIAVQFPFN